MNSSVQCSGRIVARELTGDGARRWSRAPSTRSEAEDSPPLRAGLAVVTDRESVWISPGIPFVVPMFLGLVAALTYGDLLVGVMGSLGVL